MALLRKPKLSLTCTWFQAAGPISNPLTPSRLDLHLILFKLFCNFPTQPRPSQSGLEMASQQDLQELLRLLTVGRKIPMMQAMTQIKALQAADLKR